MVSRDSMILMVKTDHDIFVLVCKRKCNATSKTQQFGHNKIRETPKRYNTGLFLQQCFCPFQHYLDIGI